MTRKTIQAGTTTEFIEDLNSNFEELYDQFPIRTDNIGDKAVKTGNIDDKAVKTSNIDDKAVTTSQIADKAVTTSQIDNGAVTYKQIASDSNFQKFIGNLMYPRGSYYWSDNAVPNSAESPVALFGGTWEQITDKFILAAGGTYAVGDTGGEPEVKLTKKQMPTHNHPGTTSLNGSHTHTLNGWAHIGAKVYSHDDVSSVHVFYTQDKTMSWSGNHTHTVTTEDVGNSEAHNNMPPYYTTYVWRRTGLATIT